MKKLLSAFAIVFGMSSLAHAGMLVEPYLGYQMGDSKYQYAPASSNSEYTDKLSGVGYGLRLGYKFLVPWVALDYTGVSGTDKVDYPGIKDMDFTKSSLGLVAGADLVLLRAWAGYGFSNQMTLKGDSGNPDYKFKGTYIKAGLGLGFIPLVSLNLEYQINNFDKVDVGSGEQSKSDVFDTLKHDTIMFSVSAPFNL